MLELSSSQRMAWLRRYADVYAMVDLNKLTLLTLGIDR